MWNSFFAWKYFQIVLNSEKYFLEKILNSRRKLYLDKVWGGGIEYKQIFFRAFLNLEGKEKVQEICLSVTFKFPRE